MGKRAHALGSFQAGLDGFAIFVGGARAIEGGLGFGNDDGEGSAKFVGGVSGELFLLCEGGFKTAEGGVEKIGKLAEFAVGVFDADALGKIAAGNLRGGFADVVNRLKSACGQNPSATERKEQD